MNRTLMIVIAIVAVVAVGGASFYGGTVYGKGQAQAQLQTQVARFAAGRAGGAGGAGGALPGIGAGGAQGAAGQRGGAVFGQVVEVSDGIMVITDSTGKEQRVRVSDTTLVQKSASVPITEVQKGETVTVSGTAGQDGVIVARSVQVLPAGTVNFGQPGAGGTR